MKPIISNAESAQQTATLNIDQALKQALAHHQAGQLQDAERLYRTILQAQPNHAEANHNIGVLAVQMKQPATGLPHFEAALNADPNQGQYWLSYIDALIEAALPDVARQVLELVRQRGLQGEAVEALEARLKGGIQVAEQSSAKPRHALKESLPVTSAKQQNSKKPSKIKPPDETPSHSTRLSKNNHQMAGYKPGKSARKSVLHQEKNPSPQEINTLGVMFTGGRYTEAAALAQAMTARFPLHGFGWKVLGAVFKQMGRDADALAPMQKAAALSPNDADAHSNLGATLNDLGRLNNAEVSYRRALQLKPDYATAHNNLGNTLKGLGRLEEAEASYRQALQIKPDFAEAHYNLGVILKELGRLEEAEASYRRALQLKPDYATAHNNLGNTLRDLGRLDEAEASYRRALQLKPDYADARYNLGNTLKDTSRLNEAEASYRQALRIKPDYAEAHNNLGNTLNDLGRLEEAEASYRQALRIKPDYAEAHSNMGSILSSLSQLNEAEASYRQALRIKPDFAEAHSNLGSILSSLSRLNEAEASYRQALRIKPDFAEVYSNLLFFYSYHALIDPQEYLALARNWEHACLSAQDRQVAQHRIFQRLLLADRRLRVGYVSGDYRQHAVSYFIEQLFTHHDRTRIELFAYSTHGQTDAATERIQALAEYWVPVVGMSDAAARDRIEADGIDVLIDLSGHTRHNCLGVFARRAAPVQAHYLGYFASTGLTEMDYWIGDEILTPPETGSHFSEQLWRLPRVWVSYEGKAEAPLPGWKPSGDGTVWLGSFNNLGKLTPATLALWAKVLHALPEGKLLLKTKELRDIGNRQRILDALSSHGISSDRIELQDSNTTPDWSAHMAYYDRLDIALDPVGGVGGGTTTCDALWMGVPVMALEGDRMASRMTASMLNAIGHPEWIAHSEEEYSDKVVALARDVGQRKALRSIQRKQMASSPLCDAKDLAANLEDAYFEMFERWLNEKSDNKN